MPSPAPQLRLVSLRLPRYFTQEEVRRFLGVIRSPRDQALFTLIYHHGLRVGEVALLTCGDVELERRRILIRRSKRGAWSEQVLFGATVQLLRRILDTGVSPATPLFPGRCGPLRKRRIQVLFTRYRDAAELRRDLTCHSLRHAIATHLLDAGVSLEVIQDHLGHQSIRSTSIYARITSHRRAALFARLEGSPWIVQPDLPTPSASDVPPPRQRSSP
jgi:integrase/recombinase XerD